MNWIVAWILLFVAIVGCAVTFATAVAGMGVVALIAGSITFACAFALFAAEMS